MNDKVNEKKRSLGRGLSDLGLSELLGDVSAPLVTTTPAPLAVPAAGGDSFRQLSVDQLSPGRYQPRRHIAQEALQELADSIRSQGIIQPILARRINTGFEIIAGERRWRAAQLAGLTEVPVIVRDVPDEAAAAIALIENIQRRDLNAIEEAIALQRLINEFALTHQEVADAVGKTRTVVTNLLRLLKLNPEVRTMVELGEIEMGHARALLALDDSQQLDTANKIVSRKLSVRDTEQLIRVIQEGPSRTTTEVVAASNDPNVKRLQRDLSERLGASVSIQHQVSGKGKMVVQYSSLDELDGILEKIIV